jgi:acyl-CoA reductase-like NAD-dependent aldehyde dehydrogenase
MIIKPSMKSPFSTIYLGKVANEAGVPPGVLNIIPGGPITGGLLATHMDINYITFTGGLEAGREVARLAAISNLKRVKLELGGKSPSLIFGDANLDVAIPWCVNGITLLSGQVCSASSRVYVHESVKDEVINRMKAAFEAMEGEFGNPLDKTTKYGPLVDEAHFDRVTDMVERGRREATLVTGGKPLFEKVYCHTYLPLVAKMRFTEGKKKSLKAYNFPSCD